MYQNTMLNKDLRPLNTAQAMPEETRVSPVATSGRNIEGFYINPPHDAGSPGAIPVYYPAAVPDAGFVGLAYSNAVPGVAGWCPRMPTAMVASPGANLTPGYSQNPNFGTMVGSNASDQASDEGGDDSVSGKKVKFLCSFGGKILPRPSDGMLRYVGGQTRIISVRRDVNFNELVQKMVDACGQNVVIKYQLPEEDLDALVSVSCPDDLENMMDEYEKLVERSSDGLAKLRVFLFSASELDCSGMVQFGEQDSGQRYVEAVNGITEGVDDSIMRKESIASAASTQNSDLSGTEAIDNSSHGKGDVIGPPSTGIISPKSNSTTSQEPAPRFVCMDPSPSIYAEASSTPLGIVMSGPPQSLSSQPEYELERSVPATIPQQQIGVELQQPGVNFHPPIAYMHPQQETWNRADYVQVPSQMGFPTHLMGTIGPVFTRPQFHDNAAGVSPHQFVPAVHMTMTSSHANMKPNMVQPMVQRQPIRLEHHPDESTYGGRVVQLPGDQILNAYQAQAPPAMMGGVYGWNQVPQPEQVVFSEGWVPQQQVMVPEKIPRFKDCYMCEKELPHAHSDTIVQDQRESPVSPASDLNPVFHSLQLEDKMGAPPMNRAVVTGALGEVEQGGIGARQNFLSPIDHEARKPLFEVAGSSQNVVRQYESDRIILQKTENPDLPKVSFPQGVGGPAGIQSPYGAAMSTPPQPCHESAAQQFAVPPQYHVQPEVLMNKPVDYSSKLSVVAPKEDTVESYDHVKQIDGMMESLWISPTEAFANNEQSKLTSDNLWKEDILDARPQQIAGREPCLVNTSSKPRMVVDKNQNFRPLESYEVAQPPLLGKPTYQQSKLGINFLAPDEGSYGTPAFSGVDSAHTTERIPPVGEWKDNPSRFQPKVPPGDADTVAFNGKTPSSISPSNRVGDTQNISNSLFSNQDPWNLQHDHFPPPIPNKIAIRKAGFGATDFFGENHLGNVGELPMGNRGDSTEEVPLEDGVYQPAISTNMDFGSEQVRTTQGSAEELIKQELQAVAEGVAASVLQSSMPSNPDIAMHETNETFPESNQDSEVQDTDVELHKDDFEDIKSKLPEKTNLVFPISDGIGRLQIIKNSDLEELRELGSGTFGTVYHGKWRGTDVAIKRINDRCFAGKPSEQERMRDDFWNEAINLADLHHPNVVAFYGVVLDGPGGSVATVTEYMVNGSLRNALQKNERNLDKRKRLLIAMDVAFGMEYLHGKNIVHFDLKSDNLLVNLRDPHRPICKVGDLGLSKVKCQTLISGGVRGTLPWMAPELLNGSSSLVSEKVDVFSFGIVLWELLTGEEPYADLHYGAIIGGIVSNTLRPPVPELCDSEWRALMERCWSSEPQERPSFTEIANGLRAMASKIPPKAQAQQQVPSTLPQVKS